MAKRTFTPVPDHVFGGDAAQDQLETMAPLVDPVWTQIAALADSGNHVRILFTSPQNGAGTTLLTAATAAALARHMRARVLMVESHMRRPAAAGYLGTEQAPGLSDLMLGHAQVEDVVRQVPGIPDLELLPAGTARPAIAGEFATAGAREILEPLTARAKYTLFDAPPLTDYREARGLLTHVDAAVIVLRSRVSLKSSAIRLAELIEAARVPILGTILNRHQSEFGFLSGKLGAL